MTRCARHAEQETTRELVNEELSATEKGRRRHNARPPLQITRRAPSVASCTAFVKDTLNTLRAEVEELAKTAWLHETSDASIGCRIKL